jgi:hypothetical protein
MPVSVAVLGLVAVALVWVLATDRRTRPSGEHGYLPDRFSDRLDLDFTDADFDWPRDVGSRGLS